MNTHTPKILLVTGGAGFIGANFIRHVMARHPECQLINLDCLTYAGNPENLAGLDPERHHFVRADIRDRAAVGEVFEQYRPDTVVNFAAESHVDRSIDNPLTFIETNVTGTAVLLDAARRAWKDRDNVRFHHISTDEVFGSLTMDGDRFTESTPLDPSSPYSASKAGADLLVQAYFRTYGLSTTISNCSNNYGPYQFPEKLIPLMICRALEEKPLPVYGKGANVRDWLHVEDHAEAIWLVLTKGKPGRTYAVGGDNEWNNLDLVNLLCARLDEIRPRSEGCYADLIEFVKDRPGHDFRYAVDSTRIRTELGWTPKYTFADGLDQTIRWYLDNPQWVADILSGTYNCERLGSA